MVAGFICLIYSLLMVALAYAWWRMPADAATRAAAVTKVSIVVPARNEEHRITTCLEAIARQTYPQHLVEVIVVDDHSTDNTFGTVRSMQLPFVEVVQLKDFIAAGETVVSYKKKALATGISLCTGTLIITTDADCVAEEKWLETVVGLYESEKPEMIAGPVSFTSNGSLLHVFQSLDFMTMQGITAAVHYLKLGVMCNGANLAFTKKVFEQVGGYDGVNHLVSGDDYLLMMKVRQRYPDRIAYLKSRDAIVNTPPQPDWSSFLQQRIRWASKSGKYKDPGITAVLLLVYMLNVVLLACMVNSFVDADYWEYTLVLMSVKTAAELIFIVPVAHFFNKKRQLIVFPFLQPLHILYIVMAGFLGFAGTYRWKERVVKQKAV